MPMKKIIERINKITQNKVESVIERGRKKAEEIEEEIEKEKQRRLDELEKEKNREIQTMKNRIISQAKLEAKKEKLKVREEMIEEVFNRAKEELDSKQPGEYKGYLKQSIDEANKLLEGKIKIRCEKKAEKLVQKLAGEIDPEMDVKADLKTIGGIKAISEKGSTMDLTFEANLKRRKKELRKEISDILFEED